MLEQLLQLKSCHISGFLRLNDEVVRGQHLRIKHSMRGLSMLPCKLSPLVISFRCWICNTDPMVRIIALALQCVYCCSVAMSFHFQYCSCMISVRVCVCSHRWCCSSSAMISSSFSLWRPISAFCRLMISLYLLSSSSQRGRSSSRHFNYRTTHTY